MRTVIFWILLSGLLPAQTLRLSHSLRSVVDAQAEVVDGLLILPKDVKVATWPAAVIEVAGARAESFIRVTAKSLSVTQENGQLRVRSKSAKVRGKGLTWLVYGEPGVYTVTVDAVEDGKIKSGEIEDVELSALGPDVVPDELLTGLPGDVQKLTREYLSNMSKDFAKLSADASAKSVNTVMEASVLSNKYDEATRKAFKLGLNSLMEPKLGNAALPATAPQVFLDISKGFGTR